jgi:hypothetical protein
VDEGTAAVTPYGTNLALLADARGQLLNGLWLRIEVRDGRPQAVAVESEETSAPITSRTLRFPVERAVRALIRVHTVRLVRDPESRQMFGVYVTSSSGAGETRSVEERGRDVDREVRLGKRGRPPKSDEFLRQLAAEWDDAHKQGEGAVEIAIRHGVATSTVRQWMFKARARGLVRKEDENG